METLACYPNEQLKSIAGQQVRENGKLMLFRSTTTVYFGETCNDHYHGYGLLIYRGNLLRFY